MRTRPIDHAPSLTPLAEPVANLTLRSASRRLAHGLYDAKFSPLRKLGPTNRRAGHVANLRTGTREHIAFRRPDRRRAGRALVPATGTAGKAGEGDEGSALACDRGTAQLLN